MRSSGSGSGSLSVNLKEHRWLVEDHQLHKRLCFINISILAARAEASNRIVPPPTLFHSLSPSFCGWPPTRTLGDGGSGDDDCFRGCGNWLTSSFICFQWHREATSAVSSPSLAPFCPAEEEVEEEARWMKAWKDPPSPSDPSESEFCFFF